MSKIVAGPSDKESAELESEVLNAVAIAISEPDRPAIRHFSRIVTQLRWTNPRLTRTVKAYAAKLKAEAALTMPDLCSDMRAWSASAFQALPTSVTSFDQHVSAAEVGPREVPRQLLTRYIHSDEAHIFSRTKRLETELETAEFKTGVQASFQIAQAVGFRT